MAAVADAMVPLDQQGRNRVLRWASERFHDVAAGTRPKPEPQRRAVTGDRLAEVLDAYNRGGIEAAAATAKVNRRQAYRLIERAQRDNPQPV
jgi:hypothetical protein